VDLPPQQAMELLVKKLAATESNAAFLERMKVT
jgi:transcription termination factor Rho